MDTKDREAIEGLFSKLGEVERQAGARDADAEAFIGEQVARNPGAPYYMAQTIVMQELAIGNQQREIDDLKRQVETLKHDSEDREQQGDGGFLSRILGGGSTGRSRTSVPSTGPGGGQGNPWGSRGGTAQAAQYGGGVPMSGFGGGMGGGGFLAGAAQTAMGVAGGVVLGNALGGLFGGHGAATPAAETAAADKPEADAGQTADAAPADDNGASADGGFDNASFGDAPADDGGDWGGGDSGGGFDDI